MTPETASGAALAAAVARLREAGVEAAARDARRLLAHALGTPPERLALHLDAPLGAAAPVFADAVAARAARQPLAQIVGQRLFHGRAFRVTRDVLDPRPETEAVVAAALAETFATVLDLGTGSGCILLTLLAERPGTTGLGTDLSAPALAVAAGNAAALGLSGRAAFVRADWFDGVTGRFDLIVSNPPYIAAADLAALDPEVRDWEPAIALTPGGDGLAAYRAIAAGGRAHLQPGGRLVLEIGAGQDADVRAILAAAGWRDLCLARDLDGRPRVVVARA